MEMADLIERGWPDERIGARVGTSAEAVNLARKRHHIHARSTYLLSTRAVARELGIPCSKTVTRWVARRYLRGKRGQTWGPYRQWYVERDHLLDFLDDPRYWHLWDPERIPDPATREHYQALRTERYLTTGEVAERLYVEHPTVQAWIQSGVLPAVRHGNWLVAESTLVGFTPPGQRSKAGMTKRAWTEREDATLLDLRARGWSWRRIAVSMDRTIGSVANRFARLDERRLAEVA
jgi:excisionase family DNA binding protein